MDPVMVSGGLGSMDPVMASCSCANNCTQETGRNACACLVYDGFCDESCECGPDCQNMDTEAMEIDQMEGNRSSSGTGSEDDDEDEESSASESENSSGSGTDGDEEENQQPTKRARIVKANPVSTKKQQKTSGSTPLAEQPRSNFETKDAQSEREVLLELVGGRDVFVENAVRFLAGDQTRLDQFLQFVANVQEVGPGSASGQSDEAPGTSGGDGSTPPVTSVESSALCVCGKCRVDNLPGEEKCCGRQNCLTNEDVFLRQCLDREALTLAIDDHADVYAGSSTYNNNNFRFQAYRRFTLWHRGKLGRSKRVPVYSCVAWTVRARYPDPHGKYRGFKAALNQGQQFN